ncbi:MAG: hypothetical protein HUJ56_11175 [Erysipelotrichaceae bacterium]|nr:hypothetical protein [Erysipelotrichaceae bacterium]
MGIWDKLKENLPTELTKGIEEAVVKVEQSGVIDDIKAGVNTAKDKIEQSGIIDDIKLGVDSAKDKLDQSGILNDVQYAAKEGVNAINKVAEQLKTDIYGTTNPTNDTYDPAITGSIPYFTSIIYERIPGVEVRESVNLSEVSSYCPVQQVKIDILIYKNGNPKVAILLIPKSQLNDVAYTKTMLSLQKSGINVAQFTKEDRNDPTYVVKCIQKELSY